jgi:hypothetical protein
MSHRNEFVISNGLAKPLKLNIEPEAAMFSLPKGEEVHVTDVYESAPVTVRLTTSERGEPIVSIWPGDGNLTVAKDGVNVLDLVQSGSQARSA